MKCTARHICSIFDTEETKHVALNPGDQGCCYCSVVQLCPTLCNTMDCTPPRLLCPWDSPGKNTGVGSHFLLQRNLPTQRSNPHLLHWQADSLPLSYQEDLALGYTQTYCISNGHKSQDSVENVFIHIPRRKGKKRWLLLNHF